MTSLRFLLVVILISVYAAVVVNSEERVVNAAMPVRTLAQALFALAHPSHRGSCRLSLLSATLRN